MVITVSNEPISINTFFHFEIFRKPWCPEGHDFEKSNKPLITPTQAIGLKIPDSETLLEFFENQATKNDEFFFLKKKKLIFGNLVRIKTC